MHVSESKYSYFDEFMVTDHSSIYDVNCANARILIDRRCISLPAAAAGKRILSMSSVPSTDCVTAYVSLGRSHFEFGASSCLESGRSNQHH